VLAGPAINPNQWLTIQKTAIHKSQITNHQVIAEEYKSRKGENVAVEQDLWNRGFQLAYFLYPERGTALRILSGALNKLRVQRVREVRRSYWRDKHLKRGITRITRDESDALQWLIFYESDLAEKQQEDQGAAIPPQMIVRYIKNLVRMTTSMSSFYVNVGLHRLLYNYSTAEAQRVYEAVTERFLGADEYRRAKSALMKKLLKRFHGMLKTSRTQHGELRFETLLFETRDQQEVWARLVDICLRNFTPWSTLQACPVPQDYDATRDKLPPRLSGNGGARVDPNRVEMNRCHAFIDPICDGRLMEALLLQPPQEKLALPRFYMENQDTNNHPAPSDPISGLTPEEREDISKQLSGQSTRRKQADPQQIIVVVDGEERAQLQLKTGDRQTIQLQLEEGDELIEVRTRFAGEDLLLAIHPVAYTESRGLAAAQECIWRGDFGTLNLVIEPAGSAGEEPALATATFDFHPHAFARARRTFWLDRQQWLPRLAFAGMALLIAGLLIRYTAQRNSSLPTLPATATSAGSPALTPPLDNQPLKHSPSPAPIPQLSAAHIVYRLVPDEQATRGAAGIETVIAIPSKPTVIELELPVASDYAQESFRATLKLFFKPGEVLSKKNLRPTRSKNALVVSFAVPSEKLQAGQDYAVELQTVKPGEKPETVESYGFRIK
jgi:hypothetical protein